MLSYVDKTFFAFYCGSLILDLTRQLVSAFKQHISDLTQEKYSLQRGLEAARELADTLTQENIALMGDFNAQVL